MKRPTLLLIHGLVGSLNYFRPAGRISSAAARTIDLLGYGSQRDAEPERLTLDAQAEYVAQFLEKLGCGPVWLLGHSMGGAVAMVLADRRAELVGGIVNVEGNFTLKDAFWSSRIVAKPPDEWSDEYQVLQGDVPGWLERCGIQPTPQRVGWAREILENQTAATVYAMSQALLKETAEPAYLEAVRRVIRCHVPIHLIAGERSAADWDVPGFVSDAASSYTELPQVGHLMMLEEPETFCRAVDSILAGARG